MMIDTTIQRIIEDIRSLGQRIGKLESLEVPRSPLKLAHVFNAGSITANNTLETTATVTGAAIGDTATVTPASSLPAGVLVDAYVSAPNTVTLRFANITVAAIDPPSNTFHIRVIKA